MTFVFGQDKNFILLCPLDKTSLNRLHKDQDKASPDNPYIFIIFLLAFTERRCQLLTLYSKWVHKLFRNLEATSKFYTPAG